MMEMEDAQIFLSKSDQALEQYPLDEVINEKDRMARSWASVEVTDKQGEVVPISEFKRALTTWMKRGAPIQDMHSNKHIGQGLGWREKVHPQTGKAGIEIDYRIFDDYSTDDDVWEAIKNGKYKGLSIGGKATQKPTIKEDSNTGRPVKHLRGIELHEISAVDNPANQFALNQSANYIAKSLSGEDAIRDWEALFFDLQKGYAAVDIQKPFAGFSDFASCEAAQKERGHTEDSASRICGWLKSRTEKAEDSGSVGFQREKAEHPSVEDSVIRQLVADHLKADPNYYEKEDEFKMADAEKGQVYLKPGEKAPEGVSVQQGPKGGRESKSLNAETPDKENKKSVIPEVEKMKSSETNKDEVVVPPAAEAGAEVAPPAPAMTLEELAVKIDKLTKAVTQLVSAESAENGESSMAMSAKAEEAPAPPAKAEAAKAKECEEEKKLEKPKDEEKKAVPSAIVPHTTEDVNAAVDKKLESMGIRKATTPRPEVPAPAVAGSDSKDPLYGLVQKAMKRQISLADMNRQLRKASQEARDARIQEVLGRVR